MSTFSHRRVLWGDGWRPIQGEMDAGAGEGDTRSQGTGGLRQQLANQPEAYGPRFGAARYVPIGNTLGIVILMKRQAGYSHRDGWKNEPGLRAGGAR
jgi:hypothetical protein